MPIRPIPASRANARNRMGAALVAAAMAAIASPISGNTFAIDGVSRLDALSASLPASGVQRVRFTGEGYRNPGSLALSNNGCDTLVFERMSPFDTSALRVQGSLLRIQGQKGVVVLRGLALKFEGAGALFDTSMGGNHELIIDGCTFLGNAAGPAKVLAWSGDGKVSLANCMFTNVGATALNSAISVSIVNSMFVSTGPITVAETSTSGGIALFNNLFNFPGVLSAPVGGRIEMWFNTANRTQFNLDGKSTATFSIHNNYFANPPAINNVPEAGMARYPVLIKPGSYQTKNSIAAENVRYSTWDGFENPAVTPLFGAGNASVPPARDSALAWDWRIPSDSSHGAWNGNLPLPSFNLFPSDTSLDIPIAGGRAIVAPSRFPRLLRFTLKAASTPYSASLSDSTRAWFRSDSLLALNGNAAVAGLILPTPDNGIPLLFAHTDAGYLPGIPGPRGSTLFRNAHPEAREFIPALGGQNTPRGSNVATANPGLPGLTLVFSQVTRAGMTTFGASQRRPSERRWRIPQYQGREIAFTAATTAEGSGTVRFGIPAAGTTVFKKDSLFFWRGGDPLLAAKDSAGGYWAAIPSPLGKMEAMLVERMTFGPGADSLILPQARIISNSAAGYQFAADSGFRISSQDEPAMAAFGAVLKFSWPGRLPGDSLFASFPRSDSLQRVWIRRGGEAVPFPVLPGDPRSLRVALGIGDSGQPVFVARKFRIPGAQAVNLAFGPDSILGLYSSRPGDMAIDSLFRPSDLDTTRLSILAARRIGLDSLVPLRPYTLALTARSGQRRELVRALVLVNSVWDAATFTESGGRYSITVPPLARAAMVVEFPSLADWAPAQPAAKASMALHGDSLRLSPGLTPAERTSLPLYRADLLSLGPTGILRVEATRYAPVESSLSVGLAPDRLYAYRVVYRSSLDRFSPDLGWIPLSGKQPSLAAIEDRIPMRKEMFRHLVGFPFDGATVGTNVKAGMEGGAGEILALDTLVSGKWDGVPVTDQTPMERGKGYLLAAGKPFRAKAQGAVFSGLKPDTLRFDQIGWHLIANPLPFPFARSALGIPDSAALSFPRALRRQDTATGSRAVYTWPVPDTLQPFEGYLLYVFKPTYLAFDPYSAAARAGLDAASGAPSRAAGKTAAPAAPTAQTVPAVPAGPDRDAFRMTLSGPGGTQSAVFYRSGPYLQTPYMRPISEAGTPLEFRVGEGAGWAFRKVDRVDSLRIPIEIVAPQEGTYALSLSGGDAATNAAAGSASPDRGTEALLDLGSGMVHRAADLGSLPLSAGPHAFVLLHGNAVAPGIAAFSASLPAEFVLEQNAPNPFHGRTRVRYRVPGGLGETLKGRFRVMSLAGRVIEARDLGALTVGEHTLTVGEGLWRPGVYLYELRLETERGARVLRKKMVCGPAGG